MTMTPPTSPNLYRRLRGVGGKVKRKVFAYGLHLLASTDLPHKIISAMSNDNDTYVPESVSAKVMVYFAAPANVLYQIEPWLPTFEAVHERYGLIIICANEPVAELLRTKTGVPVLSVARYAKMDELLRNSDVGLAIYVSHRARNFDNLRFTSMLHVHIGHGESDKAVSTSNQLKAYDYNLVPGQAAIDRAARNLMRYDAAAHSIIVGQPATLTAAPKTYEPGSRITVLYAPTWEGGQPSVAYGSVASHGLALAQTLLADGRFDILYRPHPLTGVDVKDYADANRAIKDAINTAGGDNMVITPDAESMVESFARADVLIADISAVSTAWLPSHRPMMVTEPASGAQAAGGDLLANVPRLGIADIPAVPGMVADLMARTDPNAPRDTLTDYYFSEYCPDRSEARFVEVVGDLLRERDELREKFIAEGDAVV